MDVLLKISKDSLWENIWEIEFSKIINLNVNEYSVVEQYINKDPEEG
jgi:hypothetical protein